MTRDNIASKIALILCAASFQYSITALPVQANDREIYDRRFRAAMDAGQYADAERYAGLLLQASNADHSRADSLLSLAMACRKLKKLDQAEKYDLEALKIPLDASNPNNGWILNNLGLVYTDEKRFADSETMLQRALQVFLPMKGANSSQVASVYNNLGDLFLAQKKWDQAERNYHKSLEIRRAVFGIEHIKVAESLNSLADVSRNRQRYDESQQRYNEALAMNEKLLGGDNPKVAAVLDSMGILDRDQGKFAEAEAVDRRALKIRETAFGLSNSDAKASAESLAKDLDGLDRKEEAEALRNGSAAALATTESKTEKQIEIVSDSANVMDGSKVAATVRQGQKFQVTGTNGAWYSIRLTNADKPKTGWIHERDVKMVTTGSESNAPVWQKFSPPGLKCSLEFPGSPRVTKKTASGLDITSFLVDSADLSYDASYTDVPAENSATATLDTVMNMYASRYNGTFKSQKSIQKDRYPGKDALIELPDRSYSRSQVFIVGRRWFALEVKGSGVSVNGDDANRFFNSFTFTK